MWPRRSWQKKVKGYREEDGVNPESTTETYAAVEVFIDNWRWKRCGLSMWRSVRACQRKVTEVVIHFKNTGIMIYLKVRMLTKKDNN